MRSIIWRVKAGDEEKDLVPLMLHDQVMIIGPGEGTRDIRQMSREDLLKACKGNKCDRDCLERFYDCRNGPASGNLVVLLLGTVCFSVGYIEHDEPFYDGKYSAVISCWNSNKCCPDEDAWHLQHARRVKWFGITNSEALCHFRKGMYGGGLRFCRVSDGGNEKVSRAKKRLDDYLCNKLSYHNTNGAAVLSRIGKPCSRVNEFGFPAP